jgi:hypothetical protein
MPESRFAENRSRAARSDGEGRAATPTRQGVLPRAGTRLGAISGAFRLAPIVVAPFPQ